MLQANVEILRELKGFVHYVFSNKELLHRFTRSARDFTRERKLGFSCLVLLILRLCKKSLSVELDSFFEQLGSSEGCTASAFSQQRGKLSALFFACWNEVLWRNFYRFYHPQVRRWRDYRVVALDGSSVPLVNKEALDGYFGGQRNQHGGYTCGETFYCYDVLNEMVLYAALVPYRYGELNLACAVVPQLSADMLALYDRNFACYKLMALHQWQEREIKFVVRAKENLRVVKEFLQSGEASSVAELLPGAAAIRGLRQCGYLVTPHTPLKVRLVRVELEGSVEVLFTNLWAEEGYAAALFGELYFMRWGGRPPLAFTKTCCNWSVSAVLRCTPYCRTFTPP